MLRTFEWEDDEVFFVLHVVQHAGLDFSELHNETIIHTLTHYHDSEKTSLCSWQGSSKWPCPFVASGYAVINSLNCS